MIKGLDDIKSFVMIAFLLLGVLFGMVIMAYMFGNLGVTSVSTFPVSTDTITNESGAFINETGYTVSVASLTNFSGGVTVTQIFNSSNGVLLASGNYSVNSATGVITNASTINWVNVNVTYTYNYKTPAQLSVENTNNNSLQAIAAYSSNASTQFTTVAIAITLLVLIALFLVFWYGFIRPMIQNKKTGVFR